jgi:hypothetical protein
LCTEADAFGCIADSKHGNALSGNKTPFPEVLQGIAAPVMLCYHPQTGWAAIHGIELLVVGESFNH